MQQMKFQSVIFLFLFRVSLFSSLHSVFYFIHEPQVIQLAKRRWRISDVIAVVSYCWIIIVLMYSLQLCVCCICSKLPTYNKKKRTVVVDDGDDNDDDGGSVSKRENIAHSILLVPQVSWYSRDFDKVNADVEIKLVSPSFTDGGLDEIAGNNSTAELLEPRKKNNKLQNDSNKLSSKASIKYIVTPWVLWCYVYAAGIALFVLGYSICGLSLLSEMSIILSSNVIFPLMFGVRGGNWFPIHYISAIGISLSVIMLAAADKEVNKIQTWWDGWCALWTCVVLPTACSLFLCRCGVWPGTMQLSAAKVLSFAMPSLAVMSALYLGFYFSLNQDSKNFHEWQQLFENSNGSYVNWFTMLSNVENLGHSNNTADMMLWVSRWSMGIDNTTASGLSNMQDFIQAGQGLEILFENSNIVSIVSLITAPLLLWVTMLAVIRAIMQGVSETQSMFSSYVLVLAVRQYLTKSGGDGLYIAAMVFAVPSCIITLIAEAWKISLFYSHLHFAKDEENEKKFSVDEDVGALV